MNKKLYLRIEQTHDIFLMKLEDGWIEFVDGEDYSERLNPEDLYFISRGFSIPIEVLEDFYYNA